MVQRIPRPAALRGWSGGGDDGRYIFMKKHYITFVRNGFVKPDGNVDQFEFGLTAYAASDNLEHFPTR